jgi:hypothetical protein
MASDLIVSFTNGSTDVSFQVELFYNGTAAAFNKTFAEFLSIPSTSSPVGPLSYLDIVKEVTFPDGAGSEFAGSVLAGIPAGSNSTALEAYVETYRLFNDFVATYGSSKLSLAILSFTPVLQSQIQLSYAKGGNVISPPKGTSGFNEVLFGVIYQPGVTEPLANVEKGRQHWMSNTPRTPGLPLLLNEVDASQNAYASYGGYQFLKQVYAKYDPSRFNINHTPGPVGL